MVKAILFDLDDTLLDWGDFANNWEARETKHLRLVFDYLNDQVQPLTDFDTFRHEYLRRTRDAWSSARHTLHAPHLGRILTHTAVACGIPESKIDPEKCLDAFQWGVIEGVEVFPDVIEALTLLRDRGLRFGIVTNAFQPMRLRDHELAGHGLLDFFPECRFSAADVGYLKPHEKIFAAALDCLGTAPGETLFVGDNPTADIAGAQNAGMQAILRQHRSPRPMLSGLIVPDATITSLLEIPSILDRWAEGQRA
jgi:putative hydrolase of the HAD superfamily